MEYLNEFAIAPETSPAASRFAKFLKVYSENNQFLVITHRRGTMEAMDTLYGVTMQEKGISYILELELKDVIENFEEVIE